MKAGTHPRMAFPAFGGLGGFCVGGFVRDRPPAFCCPFTCTQQKDFCAFLQRNKTSAIFIQRGAIKNSVATSNTSSTALYNTILCCVSYVLTLNLNNHLTRQRKQWEKEGVKKKRLVSQSQLLTDNSRNTRKQTPDTGFSALMLH